ncbi:hypothetical protein GCM10007392_26400 [Saccharospirillum salsuginis]|uniref:Aminodeoxychorismate lyase n=2 Tax=Saccharospirillum salsuginis TaxID=418750 RepID=A0A918KDI1_9GAMM|nr:hypothetical protein GCM10007392_26400 [Saccharospirillum salsuginis]
MYAISVLSHREAIAKGFDDALLLDHQEFVADASVANVFMVKNGTLHTPKPIGFLNGITRKVTLSLASELGLDTREAYITLNDLLTADEVFLTGTAYEICPVKSVGGTSFPARDITDKLRQAYRQATLVHLN